MTLTEVLISIMLLVMVAAGAASLSMGVNQADEHSRGVTEVAQQARILIDRLERTIREATASEQFPGLLVFADSADGYAFPDTLVVWRPDAAPLNPDQPHVSELRFFFPDPADGSRLLEVRLDSDAALAPPVSDDAAWQNLLARARQEPETVVELSHTMRSAQIGGVDRGAVRFDVVYAPPDDQWADYQASTLDWSDLWWPLDLAGSRQGLRQSWCRFEVQLVRVGLPDSHAVPVFGSATVSYGVSR